MKVIFLSLSLMTLLSCCKSKTEESLSSHNNMSKSKDDISVMSEDGVSPSVESTQGVSIPSPEEKIPPTQDDINLFIIQRGEHYWLLTRKFEKADYWGEVFLYALIAANKFKIDEANYDIASHLSDLFSKPDIGKHSKDIVLHFANKYKNAKKVKKVREAVISQIEHFKKLEGKGAPLFGADGQGKTPIKKLKLEVLNGNREGYDILKKKLYEKNEEERLLFYAYLMADRYNHDPARKDVVSIIENAFKKYGIGEIDSDTRYFINKATEKD